MKALKSLIAPMLAALLIAPAASIPQTQAFQDDAINQSRVAQTEVVESYEDGARGKLPADLRAMIEQRRRGDQPDAERNFIVQSKGTLLGDLASSVTGRGGKIKKRSARLNAVLASMTLSQVEEAASDPEVSFITPDRAVSCSMDATNITVGADQ